MSNYGRGSDHSEAIKTVQSVLVDMATQLAQESKLNQEASKAILERIQDLEKNQEILERQLDDLTHDIRWR